MFDQLFGYALTPPSHVPTAIDAEGASFLTDFAENRTVLSMYHLLQDEFKHANRAIAETQNYQAQSLKMAGNNHFASRRYNDAVEAYRRALEIQPGDAKLYTNMALTLVRCGRYEEAVAYAHGATIINPFGPKGFVLLAIAYAHLGYTDVATYYCECVKPFGMEVSAACERAIANSVMGHLNPSMYRFADANDLQNTLHRFSDPYLNVHQLIFLFIHLDFHMSCGNQMAQIAGILRQTGFIRRLFREFPLTCGAINHSQNLLALPNDEAHLLSTCLRITGFASCGSPQACNDLFSCPEFTFFLASSCRQITSSTFLKSMLTDRRRFSFHQLVVDNLLRTLCTATSQGSPFNRYLRTMDPFKSFSWHVKLLSTWFCLFSPLRNADIMCHLVVSVSKICEDFQPYLDELLNLPVKEAVSLFSLLATASQIFVECSIHPSITPPIQLDLLLVFWLHLTKDPRSVMFCVQSPRVWTFFANRLDCVLRNVNASTLKGEGWFLFECLCNMASFIKKNPQSSNHCFEKGPWFHKIVNSIAAMAWRKSKHHVSIRSALMLASRLASFSPVFCQHLAEIVKLTRLIRLVVSPEPDVDSPAIHCLGILLPKIQVNSETSRQIVEDSHFSEFIEKVVNCIIHASNPLSALCNDSKVCLNVLVDEKFQFHEKVRENVMNLLKKSSSESDRFVKTVQNSSTVEMSAESKKKSKRHKRRQGGEMFSEALPDDVTNEEAATRTSKLFEALTKDNDELGALARIPASV